MRRKKILLIAIIILALIISVFIISNYQKNVPSKKNIAQQSKTSLPKFSEFNDSLIYYLLLNINAGQLHPPLLSSDAPKIEINVEDSLYNAKIIDNKIKIEIGSIEEKDIIIHTTKEEAVKMANNKNYIKNSFADGLSSIELVASKPTLYLKGYLKIYDELAN